LERAAYPWETFEGEEQHMRTVNQVLLAVLLSVCIGLVVALIPAPGQRYPIPSCENPEQTYAPEKDKSSPVGIVVGELGCLIDRSKDDISALSTLVIAIFTAILGIFTVRLAYATKIAADAAKQSADVIPNLERAFVYISGMDPIIIQPTVQGQYKGEVFAKSIYSKSTVEIHIINEGRTPANITAIAMFADFRNTIPPIIPTTISIGGDVISKNILIIIGGGKEKTLPRIATIGDMTNYADFVADKTPLYCWGFIEYRDIFGALHRTDFCRKLAIGPNGQPIDFEPVGPFERNQSV
jgi:hypothetical protein